MGEKMGRSESEIKKLLLDEGVSLFGVADISSIKKDFKIKQNVLSKVNRAICIGIRLSTAIIDEIEDYPTLAYYHHYRRINNFLDHICLKLTNFIQIKGFYAYPVAASLIEDWRNQQASVSHKHIAIQAGLGWLGRNNLVITEKFGASIRFASVLTNMPLVPGKTLGKDCGKCAACVEACPVRAIKMKKEDFDHIKCFEKLKSFRTKGYVGQYICGICIKACKPQKIG
jgi:epoxyqueuosine reductase QueG